MKKTFRLSKGIEAVISDPSPHWRMLCQAIIDVSRNCVLAVDRHGYIFVANTIADEKFGAATGKSLHNIIPSLMDQVETTLVDGQRRVVPSMQLASAEYRIVIHPLKLQDELVGAICLLEESTEFENVAKQMRFFQHLTSELEAIIDSSSDGLFVCDAKANVIRVNPASERIHKVTAKQLIGKNMVDLIAEGFIDKSAALQAIEKRKTVSLLQEKDHRKMISIGTPVFAKDGTLISVVVSERDITEIDNLQAPADAAG